MSTRLAMALPLAMILAALVSAQTPDADVRTAGNAMGEAIAKRDRAALERLLDPSFTGILPTGTIHDRTSWIELAGQGGLAAQRFAEREQLDDVVSLHGVDVASRTTMTRFRDAGLNRDVCLLNRTVYRKVNEEWRAVSSQGTSLHEGPILAIDHTGLPGRYTIDGKGELVVVKTGWTLFATLPTARVARIPLFETADGGFTAAGGFVYRFTRNAEGRATAVAVTRFGKELWRASRAD